MPLVSTRGAASAQGFGEFAQSAAIPYIEDVFQTWLYTGNGSSQTITNGIDLAGKGGLVWIKGRSAESFHRLSYANNTFLNSATTAGATSISNTISFGSSGFSLGSNSAAYNMNDSGLNLASWTFREQAKFFDVVTYTGDGGAQNIAHNLGSVPGCIIVKRIDTDADWVVYHRSTGNTQGFYLNTTGAAITSSTFWENTTPTSTTFRVGVASRVNAAGGTYVAYLFAHNAGGFGLTGTDNVITCGSFTGSATVNLGYEPQWLLVKGNTSGANWQIMDSMRGMTVGGDDAILQPNTSNVESFADLVSPTATGFTNTYNNAVTFIYIAIRRGPMRTPTTGTSVFAPIVYAGNSSVRTIGGVLNPVDMFIGGYRNRAGFGAVINASRLVGRLRNLVTATTGAEVVTADNTSQPIQSFAFQTAFQTGTGNELNGSGYNYVMWQMRRAPGFFDQVCYTGTGSARTVAHNLAAVPELIIVKQRSPNATNWAVGAALGTSNWSRWLKLNLTDGQTAGGAPWDDTAPTASVFSLSGIAAEVNSSGSTYVAYLFASAPGVSKVGSYTGTGATQVINCGFTGGARFVLIKATSTTGDWYVWDSARGIVPLNDPYLRLNVEDAEVTNTDWVDTAATGFELSNAGGNLVNTNGVTYIFLAIA
jgi:hypothetical protein